MGAAKRINDALLGLKLPDLKDQYSSHEATQAEPVTDEFKAYVGSAESYSAEAGSVSVENSKAKSVWTPSLEKLGGTPSEIYSFRTSSSFAKCMRTGHWDKLMDERYVQMRFLWELQNYFLSMLPVEGISPDRHEANILCLLSFPAVEIVIVDVEEDSRTSSTKTGDESNPCLYASSKWWWGGFNRGYGVSLRER